MSKNFYLFTINDILKSSLTVDNKRNEKFKIPNRISLIRNDNLTIQEVKLNKNWVSPWCLGCSKAYNIHICLYKTIIMFYVTNKSLTFKTFLERYSDKRYLLSVSINPNMTKLRNTDNLSLPLKHRF